jgi:RNA polymerase sigma factor (sigma-70 family)
MSTLASWQLADPTDAELANAAAAGDRRAFAQIYDRYADRLHDFCVGMLRDRDSAADCVQDVFCTAATTLTQLRDSDKLRPWLYAIARNEALRRIRHRQREHLSDQLPEAATGEPGPDTLAARRELADLIARAAGGLSDRDRSVLELTYRHGLSGPELAQALGVSQSNANTLVGRLRETIERCLGALLVARQARTNPTRCPELSAILDGWDGQFTVLMRKRIARHIESCPTCDQQRRRLVSPAALLGTAPVFISAPIWLRQQTLGRIRLTSADFGSAADAGHGAGHSGRTSGSPRPRANSASRSTSTVRLGPASRQGPDNLLASTDDQRDAAGRNALGHDPIRRVLVVMAVVAAIVVTSLGLSLVWVQHQRARTSISPADLRAPAPLTPARASAPVPANNTSAAPTAGSPSPLPALTAPPGPVSGPVQMPAPASPAPAPNGVASTSPGPAGAPPVVSLSPRGGVPPPVAFPPPAGAPPVVLPSATGAPPKPPRPQSPGVVPRVGPSSPIPSIAPTAPTPPRHTVQPSSPPPVLRRGWR